MSNTLLRGFDRQAGQQLKAAIVRSGFQTAAVAPGDLPHPRQAEAMVGAVGLGAAKLRCFLAGEGVADLQHQHALLHPAAEDDLLVRGYSVPSFCILTLHWYPPEGLTAIFYLPVLVGLYMLLLHTVANDVLFGRYVCDDEDFAALSAGLTDAWRETMVFFNVEDCARSYDFAKALFNRIVDGSGPEAAVMDAWDPVTREREIAEKGSYWCDKYPLRYDQRNSSEFRLYWQYMPQFRVLDKADFVKTMAVFIMLFVFIAIVCFAAVFVIAFTRCMTIALNNRQVYEDLGKLGASRAYLYASVKGQVSRVFTVPAITGTGAIYAFYAMIMYANDGRLTSNELAGMGACLLLILAVSLLMYAVYRLTLKRVCRALEI